MSKLPLARALLLATVVALGLGAAWSFVAGLTVSTYSQSRFRTLVSERLYFSQIGEPLIRRETADGIGRIELLALDRQPVDLESAGSLISPQYSSIMTDPPSVTGIQWHNRIVAEHDHSTPENYWYLLHDGRANGRAYGVGYSTTTNRPVGYFSRQGFADSPPPRESWFQVSGHGALAAATLSAWGIPTWDNVSGMSLLADGKLWQIDVDGRTVRPIIDAPGAIAISRIQRAYATEADVARDAATTEKNERQRMLVRLPESCTVVHLESGQAISYPLPKALQAAVFYPLQLADDRLLLATQADPDKASKLIWLESNGRVSAEREFRLDDAAAGSPAIVGWAALLIAPAPLVSYWIAFWLPSAFQWRMIGATYAQAFAQIAVQLWPSVLLITLIGLALAIAAYRRQKQFGLPGAAAWAVFCFALGVPGWLAYRFLWPWPPLGACPSCEHTTPLDRPACLDCGRSFPPPRLTGAEVFA